MAKKGGKTAGEEKNGRDGPKFGREQLLTSDRYRNRRDLLSALLKDGEKYGRAEADRLIDGFMKGEIK